MKKRLTAKEFIQKAKVIYGNKYEYSLTTYKNSQTKVKIICPEHGIFEQKPNNHLNGQGCRYCGKKRKKLFPKDFIKDSNIIHNNKYNYSKVCYQRSDKKVTITCPIHGDFEQTPSNHKLGKGCIKCAHEYVIKLCKERPNILSYTGWIDLANKSDFFDSFKIYIIKCWNENEEFYKIGKTYTTLKRRFGSTLMPYNYEVLQVFEDTAKNISKLEHELHKKNKINNYVPNIRFSGMHECFKSIKIDE